MFGIVHTDPGPLDDGERFVFLRSGDIEIVADQVMSIEAPVDAHRFAEQPRALGSAVGILHRLDGPQQHGGRMPFVLRHDIHAVVHAVDHVDVGIPGRTEHDFRPFGESFSRMGGEIMGSEVRLILHNPADAYQAVRWMNEVFPEQLPGDDDRIPVIKRAFESSIRCSNQSHLSICEMTAKR